MKQQRLTGYRPAYPRKALQGAAITGLALVAMGGLAGCARARQPELQTSGVALVTEPPEEELILDGEVAIPEPPEEELVLDGEVAICEPPETPEARPTPDVVRELPTTGMVYVPEGDGQH